MKSLNTLILLTDSFKPDESDALLNNLQSSGFEIVVALMHRLYAPAAKWSKE